MRVLLAHNFYRFSAPSGEDVVFRSERSLLEKHVGVVPFERFNDQIDESTLSKKISLSFNTIWSKETYRAVASLIRSRKPDIAHFHNTFPQISPSAYVACKDHGIPVVQTLHNYRLICPNALLLRDGKPCELCVGRLPWPALGYRCYRKSLSATAALVSMLAYNRLRGSYQNHVDRYIALTRFASDMFVAGGLPAERIRIKPNFLPNPPPAGPHPRQPYAIYVGRLTEEKGVWTLLRAWESIKGLELKVVGDGGLRTSLQQFAKQKNLDVTFLGQQKRDDVLALVQAASVQVIPSECYEAAVPLVILEAYACGTPIVASNIGSIAEVVKNERTGLLFEPGNAEDLAIQVKQLLANDRGKAMGLEGRKQFEEKYTEENNYQQLMNIYGEIIATKA